ncbi:hypothetical protein J3R83DRAFT_10519 [Lanmaoa asiatica]|nr:hypothetical protein J3R83DRAFT_10519 [Lanmaoa asiatica]
MSKHQSLVSNEFTDESIDIPLEKMIGGSVADQPTEDGFDLFHFSGNPVGDDLNSMAGHPGHKCRTASTVLEQIIKKTCELS